MVIHSIPVEPNRLPVIHFRLLTENKFWQYFEEQFPIFCQIQQMTQTRATSCQIIDKLCNQKSYENLEFFSHFRDKDLFNFLFA